MHLHFICSSNSIIEALKIQYANIVFQNWLYKANSNCVLIIEPCQIINQKTNCLDKYTAPSPLWKTYLAKTSPNTKLIIAGFNSWINNENYLYLFNLPRNLEIFLEKAKTVKDSTAFPFTKEDRNKWKTDNRLWLRGMNLEDKLEQFFKGHGEESVSAAMSDFTASIGSLYGTLVNAQKKNKFSTSVKELKKFIQQDWKVFYSRWQHYYPYWQYTPFEAAMKGCNTWIPKIEHFISQEVPNITFQSDTKQLNTLMEMQKNIKEQLQLPLGQIEKTY